MRHTKLILLTLLTFLSALPSLAQDFQYQDIWYTVLDNEARTCGLMGGNPYESIPGNTIGGDIVIPAKVTYDSNEYTVVRVCGSSFRNNENLTSVILPETIESIEGGAFQECTSLTSINFPSSITSIGEMAFNSCSSLQEAILSPNITSIGNRAFEYCPALTKVELPEKLTYIDEYTFNTCENLQTIIFHEGLEEIGVGAFSNNAVETLEFPESLTKIDGFSESKNLKTIKFPTTLPLRIESWAFRNCSALETLTLPENVVNIDGFAACSSLETVVLPNSVDEIASSAFEGCDKLSSITFPSGLKKIGARAFVFCSGLIEVDLPASLEYIDDSAFADCHGLQSIVIPESVTTIENSAFYYCGSMTSLTLPASLTKIGETVFDGCALRTITYTATNPIEASENTFNGYNEQYEKAILNMPNATMADIESTTPWNLFGHINAKDGSKSPALESGQEIENDGIVYIVIDSEARTVKTREGSDGDNPGNQFEGALTIPSVISFDNNDYTVVEIGAHSFCSLSGLTSVSLPSTVKKLGEACFYNCENLSSVELPTSLTEIEGFVFDSCVGLTSITLPDGVEYVGERMFAHCKALQSATLPNSVKEIRGWAFGDTDIISITLPSELETIGGEAFTGCKNMTEISFPNSLTAIWDRAFSGCGLTSLLLPSSLQTLGDGAFYHNYYLESIELPASISSIGGNAFGEGDDKLTSVTYLAEIPIEAESGIFGQTGELYPRATLYMPNATLETVLAVSPWNLFGKIVAKDGIKEPGLNEGEDFEYEGIWYTILDEDAKTVKTKDGIGDNLLDWSNSEHSSGNVIQGTFTLPATVSYNDADYTVVEIGNNGFCYSTELESISLPETITKIGDYAFLECSSLKSVNLPESLSSIGVRGFHGCGSMTTFTLPSHLSSIGESAFESCTALTSINIPESLTSIENNLFLSCTALRSIDIPESITSIGEGSFFACSSLETIKLPASLTTLKREAFSRCNENGTITYLAETPLSTSEFEVFSSSTYERKILEMPNATLEAIQATEPWSYFQHIIAKDGSIGIESEAHNFEYEGIWYTVLDAEAKTVKTKDGKTEDDTRIPGNSFEGNLVIPQTVFNEDQEYSVVAIGDLSFYNCSSITSVILPNTVISIGSHAFYGCEAISNIELSESLEIIKDGALNGCHSLTSVQLPESLKEIQAWAFAGCENLVSINLPESLNILGDASFSDCISLKSIKIPNSIPVIAWGAFRMCRSLEYVVLPETLEVIGPYGFENCPLSTIENNAITPNSIDSDSFHPSIYETSLLKMPNATLATIQATTPWNLFQHIIAKDGTLEPSPGVGDDFEYEGIWYTVIDAEAKTCRTKSGSVENDAYVAGNTVSGEITIPETVSDGNNDYTVVEIGWVGFANSTELNIISLPSTVTSIPESAFNGCSKMSFVNLPSTLTSIGAYAFLGCENLSGLTLPETLTSVGHGAFTGCASISSIVIPESLTLIQNQTFGGCSSLKIIELPATLEGIEYGAFFGCDPNVEVTYNATTPVSADENAFSENAYANGILNMPNATLETVQATVPWNKFQHITASDGSVGGELAAGEDFVFNGLTYTVIDAEAKTCKTKDSWYEHAGELPEGFFEGTLEIPSVASIGSYDYTVVAIGLHTFDNCEPLTSIVLPETLKTIDLYAFASCRNLASVNIPQGVDSIGYMAFADCEKIASISIPESMTSLASSVFTGCTSLAEVQLPATLTSIGDYCFNKCESLSKINFPSSLAEIKESAFSTCSSLTSVTLPEGLISIGTSAFATCNNLSSISLPESLKSIGYHGFWGCGMTELTLPAGISSIGEGAFERCEKITTVNYNASSPITAPENIFETEIANIYDVATLNSPNATLEAVQATVPWNKFKHVIASDGSMGFVAAGDRFEYQGLWYNVIDADNRMCEVSYNAEDAETPYEGDIIIPAQVSDGQNTFTVVGIGVCAFQKCTGLLSISMPETITYIERYAFERCEELTKVELSENLTTIINDAFNACFKLSDISFPESLKTIQKNAFRSCYALPSISLPNGISEIGESAFAYCNGATSISIPESVTILPNGLFQGCSSLTTLNLHNSLTSIGNGVFGNCTSITSVTLPNSVETIGTGAFGYCSALESITLPQNLTYLGFETFSNCTALKSIELPESLTSIEEKTFIKCTNLQSVTFSSKLTRILTSAFESCSSLKEINLPSPLEYIGLYTFSQSGLTKVELPNNMSFIGLNAFQSCKNLKEVTFPETLPEPRYIGENSGVFTFCDSITQVNYLATIPAEIPSQFNEIVYKTALLSAPNATLESIQATSPWNKFLHITASDGSIVPEVKVESLTLSQTSAELMAGESVALTVTVLPEDATDKTVTWTSSNPAVATVDAEGKVTALALGETTITASCGDVTASCHVTVIPTPASSITLSQATAQLKVGETMSLAATVLPEDATDKTVTWTSSNPEVATVDSDGKVTALTLGESTITASCGDASATCSLSVVATLVESISISQESAQLMAGESVTLSVTVLPDEATDKSVTWISSNTDVATVDSDGKVTAISVGEATITASCGNMTATCTVTVVATPATSITLSQSSAELKAGESVTLTVTVLPEDATDKTVTWASSNPAVATVDAEGNVTAISIGEATITATCGSVNATCTVTVVATQVSSITLSQSSAELKAGESITLSVTVLPEDATDKTVTWTSSNPAVATVDANGNVTAISIGEATITAACGGVNATCTVTVVATQASSVDISQSAAQLKVGESVKLSATVLPEDATDKTITWTSSNPAVATVDANGNVAAISLGQATITAQCGEASATCAVSVVQTPAESISISQSAARLNVGETFALSAVVLPEDATDKNVTWTSSDPFVATVDANGNVTANAGGETTITARCGNVTATCIVTVIPNPAKNGEEIEANGIIYVVIDEEKGYVATKDGSPIDGNIVAGNSATESLVIPASVSDGYYDYTVTEIGAYGFTDSENLTDVTIPASIENIGEDAFSDCERLTSIIWEGHYPFPNKVIDEIGNPNLLIYVDSIQFAPKDIDHNIVVIKTADGVPACENLVLVQGYAFTPAIDFISNNSSLTQEFTQATVIGECAGWESIVLPFDVKSVYSSKSGELTPFAALTDIEIQCPFWLYEGDEDGEWKEASSIRAGIPYIISMPNNPEYLDRYNIDGPVQFNCPEPTMITREITSPYAVNWASGQAFHSMWLPLDEKQAANAMGLNVGISGMTDDNGDELLPGSAFCEGVTPRPLEAYVTRQGAESAKRIMSDQAGVRTIESINGLEIKAYIGKIIITSDKDRKINIYATDGTLIRSVIVKGGTSETVRDLTRGLYLIAGQKILVK